MSHREPSSNTVRRGRHVAILVVLVGLIGTGCSQGSSDAATASSSTTNDATTTTVDVHEQGVRFADCVREHGVADFPDPDASGQFEYGVSVTPDVWVAAVEACEHLQPPGTLSAERTPEEQSAALEFARCMRDNGVPDFPDPVNGEPLVDTYKIPSSDTEAGMAKLDAAMDTCGDLVAAAMAEVGSGE